MVLLWPHRHARILRLWFILRRPSIWRQSIILASFTHPDFLPGLELPRLGSEAVKAVAGENATHVVIERKRG